MPIVSDVEEPRPGFDESLVEVTYAALNPVDLRIATGTFYSGARPLPYVVGAEGVGRVVESPEFAPGTRVRFTAPVPGAMAMRVAASKGRLVAIPEGLGDEAAASLGIPGIAAYLSLVDAAGLRPGESVVVLGATGVSGQIAVQLACILGAGAVLAVGRNLEVLSALVSTAREASPDCNIVPVGLAGKAPDELARELESAAGGAVDVVFDPLWGDPALGALASLSTGGRLVNIGESAAVSMDIPSSLLRSRNLRIIGHSNFAVADARQNEALSALFGYAAGDRIRVDHTVCSLDQVATAWRKQAGSPGCKLLVSFAG